MIAPGGWLLDTNVVSEVGRGPRAAPTVVAWVRAVPGGRCYLSAVTVAELAVGVSTSSNPVRQAGLANWLENAVRRHYAGRIIDVTETILVTWLALLRDGQRRGATYPAPDALIASTAIVHGLTVVTRNTRDFRTIGIPLLNPWEPA